MFATVHHISPALLAWLPINSILLCHGKAEISKCYLISVGCFRLFLRLRVRGRPRQVRRGLMRKTSIEEFEKIEAKLLVLGRQLTLRDFDRR